MNWFMALLYLLSYYYREQDAINEMGTERAKRMEVLDNEPYNF